MEYSSVKIWIRRGYILLLCVTAPAIAGCWDRIEVNDLMLITGVGFDKRNNLIEMSVQMFTPKMSTGGQQPSEQGPGGGQTLVRSAEGGTIAHAMSLLQEQNPRQLFFGHDNVYVIEMSLAKEDMRSYVDFIMRNRDMRERAYVYISGGKAKDVLDFVPTVERSSAEYLREISEIHLQFRLTVKELAQALHDADSSAALPYIEMLPPYPSGGKTKKKVPFVHGSAIVKNGRMIGQVDESVTRGILWLRNEMEAGVVTVNPAIAKGSVSVRLIKSRAKLIPSIKDGKWSMAVEIKSEGIILQNTTNLNSGNPDLMRAVEQNLAEEIDGYVQMALSQIKDGMKADTFGFAEAFHRKYPGQWKSVKGKWETKLPELEVNTNIKMTISQQGLTTEGVKLPESEVRKK